jgi:bifunctional DNA-binding transcriptional regulator/antitoxin component of YhaV-PrlF toxin-antitoxin module
MSILTMDQFGRVQFPEAVRIALGLERVAQLQLEIRNAQIILTPVVDETNQPVVENASIVEAEGILERKGGVLTIGGQLEDDRDFLSEIREERIQGLMGL